MLWHRHVVRPAVARARLVFTFSTWAAREIARTCSIPESRIQLIPQGLEPFVAPARQADVQAALARFGITQPYLLAVGLGDPRKNITWLTRVVADVRRSHRGVFLVAVGGHSSHVHAQPQVLPEWVITPRQYLGRVQLLAGKPADAQRAFEADLDRFPENVWSLRGLAESLEKQGKTTEARAVHARLEKALQGTGGATHRH